MASGMTTLRDLFVHDLRELLDVERKLTRALAALSGEAVDEQLQAAFAEHLGQTERHAADLERAFALLSEPAEPAPSAGIDGILREHERFRAEQDAAPIVLDMFLTGAAARAEHYEIAAYEGVAGAASMLGEDEVAEILGRILQDEQSALEKVMAVSERLTAESVGRKPGLMGRLRRQI